MFNAFLGLFKSDMADVICFDALSVIEVMDGMAGTEVVDCTGVMYGMGGMGGMDGMDVMDGIVGMEVMDGMVGTEVMDGTEDMGGMAEIGFEIDDAVVLGEINVLVMEVKR